MVRAVQKHGSYPQIFTHYSQGYFKFAARNFYSEFLAAVRVANRLENTLDLAPATPFPQPGYRLSEPTELPLLLFHTGLDKKAFLHLNPALRSPVISGKMPAPAGYRVRMSASGINKRAHIAPSPNRPMPQIKLQE
jgi:membrane-bound lytic murein transglycosylase D